MGDFAHRDLTRDAGLFPNHATATCRGCGGLFVPDDRCYADADHIWHSRCWPRSSAPPNKRKDADG